MNRLGFLVGIAFGFAIARSGLHEYDTIHGHAFTPGYPCLPDFGFRCRDRRGIAMADAKTASDPPAGWDY